ncbi:MAG: PaaI family thioesterase [Chloroflexi bacterium]|nr:MAG: PaaI family thioesterase [Chloroflexota bacterium]
MQHKVTGKQPNSKMCVVCGLKNPFGLHAHFYELDNGELLAIFHPKDEHQGYPGRMHGGMLTAILDETIGRAIMMKYDEPTWGVTMEFDIKFKKPVPTDAEIRVVGRITEDEGRIFLGSGEILLPDGRVAVEGSGKYMKLPLDKIADFDENEQEWRVVVSSAGDPDVVEL